MSPSRDSFGRRMYDVRDQDPITRKNHQRVIENNAAIDEFQQRAREVIGLYNASQISRPTLGSYRPSNKAVVLAVAGITLFAALSGCLGGSTGAAVNPYADPSTPDFSKYATLTFNEKNCNEYFKDLGLGMLPQEDWNLGCKKFKPEAVSVDSVQKLKSGEPNIGTTAVGGKFPVNLEDMQIHYSRAKGDLGDDANPWYEDAYFGSCGAGGNDLCFAATKVSHYPVGLLLQSGDGKRGYQLLLSEAAASIDTSEWTSNPEDLAGMEYYREGKSVMVRIPGFVKKMRDRDVNYVFGGSMKRIDPKLLS